MQNIQGVAFYDFGSIKINKTPFGAAGNNHKALSGAGFGVNAGVGQVQIKASLAWRTSGGPPVSIPASAVKSTTLLLQAGLQF